jgi:hypothetical protein
LLDSLFVAETSLCLTPRAFDVEQLWLATLSQPFMHGAMVAILLNEASVARGFWRIVHPLTHLSGMWLAMEISSHVARGSSPAGFLAMMAAMISHSLASRILHAYRHYSGLKRPIAA